jgi:hypothetical protein
MEEEHTRISKCSMPILLDADLFELVRVASVPQSKTSGLAGSVRTSIERAVWQQNGSLTVLALALNNNMLLLRLWDTFSGKQPVVKVLPWFEFPSARIWTMTLSPTAEWLVCACANQNIYLVPCYSLLTVRTVISCGCGHGMHVCLYTQTPLMLFHFCGCVASGISNKLL